MKKREIGDKMVRMVENFWKVSKELLIEIISDLNKVRDIFLQCYLLLEISFFIFQCLLSHNKEKKKSGKSSSYQEEPVFHFFQFRSESFDKETEFIS